MALGCQSPYAMSPSERLTSSPHPSVPFCRIWTLDHRSVCPIILLQLLVYSSSAQTLATLSSDLTLHMDGTLVLCLCSPSTWPHNLLIILALEFPNLCDDNPDKPTLQ